MHSLDRNVNTMVQCAEVGRVGSVASGYCSSCFLPKGTTRLRRWRATNRFAPPRSSARPLWAALVAFAFATALALDFATLAFAFALEVDLAALALALVVVVFFLDEVFLMDFFVVVVALCLVVVVVSLVVVVDEVVFGLAARAGVVAVAALDEDDEAVGLAAASAPPERLAAPAEIDADATAEETASEEEIEADLSPAETTGLAATAVPLPLPSVYRSIAFPPPQSWRGLPEHFIVHLLYPMSFDDASNVLLPQVSPPYSMPQLVSQRMGRN